MFMAVAIIFMILALLDGIFRLMANNGLNTGILENIYSLHPILMVFGFLACIVMAERVSGISVIPELKNSSAPLLMVPFIAIGIVFELIGYTVGPTFLAYLGAASLFAGCLDFIIVLFTLAGKTGLKLPFHFMIVSAISLASAAVLSGLYLPAGNSGFIMLLLSFPLIFILGERVELTRFTASTSATARFRFGFALSCGAVALFAVSSALNSFFEAQTIAALVGSLFLLATLFLVLMAENQNFKLLSRSREPLQRYVISHTRVAYIWGITGLILAVVYLADSTRVDLYDPFIHSIAVGFIGTMLLAHGPVILPSVTGKKLDARKISLLPLVFLTVGNIIRVAGDLSFLVYTSKIVEILVGLSGWLILTAVIIFMREIFSFSKSTRVSSADIKDFKV